MLIHVLIAVIATCVFGYVMSILAPAIVSGALVDGVVLTAVGACTFMYFFLLAILFNKKYREEMNGPDKAP